MKKLLKIGIALCAIALTIGVSTNAFAATKNKKISRISFKVVPDIQVEQRMGEEQITVTTGGGNYSYDEHETLNTGFIWSDTDVPRIKFTFRADDGYEFNITKASQVSIVGGTYVTATRADSNTTLNVTLDLPVLEAQVGEIANVNFDNSGRANWTAVEGAGSYEVKLLRGTAGVGGTLTVYTNSANLESYMTRAGNYDLKVRPISAKNTTVAGDWATSNRVSVSAEEAKQRAQKALEEQSAGTWVGSAPFWSFITPSGQRISGEWRFINNVWYYFKEDGYAATGWNYIGDKWYYFDTVNANLYRNATTPDGYEVDITGAWIAK